MTAGEEQRTEQDEPPHRHLATRILPPEEWRTLTHTELGTVWGQLHPSWARVLVVEDGDQVVGCWALLNVWHVEGLWIAPAYRGKTSVARRLWIGMKALMARMGATAAVTASVSDPITALLERHGTALSGRAYVVRMGESCPQR